MVLTRKDNPKGGLPWAALLGAVGIVCWSVLWANGYPVIAKLVLATCLLGGIILAVSWLGRARRRQGQSSTVQYWFAAVFASVPLCLYMNCFLPFSKALAATALWFAWTLIVAWAHLNTYNPRDQHTNL